MSRRSDRDPAEQSVRTALLLARHAFLRGDAERRAAALESVPPALQADLLATVPLADQEAVLALLEPCPDGRPGAGDVDLGALRRVVAATAVRTALADGTSLRAAVARLTALPLADQAQVVDTLDDTARRTVLLTLDVAHRAQVVAESARQADAVAAAAAERRRLDAALA